MKIYENIINTAVNVVNKYQYVELVFVVVVVVVVVAVPASVRYEIACTAMTLAPAKTWIRLKWKLAPPANRLTNAKCAGV